jgi:hypothetical protein
VCITERRPFGNQEDGKRNEARQERGESLLSVAVVEPTTALATDDAPNGVAATAAIEARQMSTFRRLK